MKTEIRIFSVILAVFLGICHFINLKGKSDNLKNDYRNEVNKIQSAVFNPPAQTISKDLSELKYSTELFPIKEIEGLKMWLPFPIEKMINVPPLPEKDQAEKQTLYSGWNKDHTYMLLVGRYDLKKEHYGFDDMVIQRKSDILKLFEKVETSVVLSDKKIENSQSKIMTFTSVLKDGVVELRCLIIMKDDTLWQVILSGDKTRIDSDSKAIFNLISIS